MSYGAFEVKTQVLRAVALADFSRFIQGVTTLNETRMLRTNLERMMIEASQIASGPRTKKNCVVRRRIVLLGVGIDDVTMNETLEIIQDFIRVGGFHQIATANVDFLDKAVLDPELNDILRTCDLTLADGMPLVWASQLLGCKLTERVTGADLVTHVLRMSEQKAYRIFLLGATPERSQAAFDAVQVNFPNAVVCGRIAPAFAPITEMDNDSILHAIRAAAPDILLVAFGNPKQEKWLAMHRDRLNVPVCIGVGASLDFLSGMQPRAPQWMQRSGLEWLYRLRSEPRRLAKRYWGNAIFMARHFPAQMLANYLQIRHASGCTSLSRVEGSALVKVKGDLNALAVRQIEEQIDLNETLDGMTLELGGCTYVSANGMGWLLEVSNRLAQNGRRLRLASVTASVLAALRATFPGGIPFDLVQLGDDRIPIASEREKATGELEVSTAG